MSTELKPRVMRIILASFLAGVFTCLAIGWLLENGEECYDVFVPAKPEERVESKIDLNEIEDKVFRYSPDYADESVALHSGERIDLRDVPEVDELEDDTSRFREYDELMAVAMQGDREAQYKLAYAYKEMSEGNSFKTGFSWLRRSARSGYLPAIRDMSIWYCKGIGTEVDPIRSMAWHRLALNYGVYFDSEYKSRRTCNTRLSEADDKKVKVVYDSQKEIISRNPGY